MVAFTQAVTFGAGIVFIWWAIVSARNNQGFTDKAIDFIIGILVAAYFLIASTFIGG